MTSDNEKNIDSPGQEIQQDDEAKDLETSPYPRLDIPEGKEPELFAYLTSLPDVDMPPGYDDLSAGEQEEEKVEKTPEQLKKEALANKIRSRTRNSDITAYALLLSEDSDVSTTLEMLSKDEAFKDIEEIKGQKDTYYFSNSTMTPQYANIAVLVEEKDYPYTVAKMVRYHTEKYPAPTDVSYFTDHPYNYSKPQMEQVRHMLQNDPLYADIKEVTSASGKIYLYSSEHMTEVYAKSLAEYAEQD